MSDLYNKLLKDMDYHGLIDVQREPTKNPIIRLSIMAAAFGEALSKSGDGKSELLGKAMDNLLQSRFISMIRRYLDQMPYKVEMDDQVYVILSILSASPVHAALWAYTINYIFLMNNKKNITIRDFLTVFKDGFPSHEGFVQAVANPAYDKYFDLIRGIDYWPKESTGLIDGNIDNKKTAQEEKSTECDCPECTMHKATKDILDKVRPDKES